MQALHNDTSERHVRSQDRAELAETQTSVQAILQFEGSFSFTFSLSSASFDLFCATRILDSASSRPQGETICNPALDSDHNVSLIAFMKALCVIVPVQLCLLSGLDVQNSTYQYGAQLCLLFLCTEACAHACRDLSWRRQQVPGRTVARSSRSLTLKPH